MLNAISERWEKATRREQYILVALIAVVLFAGMWRLNEISNAARLRLQALSEQVAASGDGVDEELWSARAAEAAELSSLWKAASWQGASFGVLSAEIQARLMEIGTAAGVTSMVIEVDPSPLEIGAVSVLRFRFSGAALYRTSAPEFLAAVAGNTRRLMLDEASLEISADSAGRITVSGLAPIILDVATAPGGGSP